MPFLFVALKIFRPTLAKLSVRFLVKWWRYKFLIAYTYAFRNSPEIELELSIPFGVSPQFIDYINASISLFRDYFLTVICTHFWSYKMESFTTMFRIGRVLLLYKILVTVFFTLGFIIILNYWNLCIIKETIQWILPTASYILKYIANLPLLKQLYKVLINSHIFP